MTLPFLPLVGIDIGPSAVKVAELSRSTSSHKLKALGLELLPQDAIADGVINNEEAVESAVLHLLEKLKIDPRGRRAAIAISGQSIELKRVQVEMGEGPIAEIIDELADQHLQHDMEDLYFRYRVLETSPSTGLQSVLLVGAMRDVVDQQINLLRNCGLRTGVVDCSELCVANMFEYNYPTEGSLTVLLDVGSQTSSLILLKNGQYMYRKNIQIGGDEYTRQITQNMGLDFDHAETLKISINQGSVSAPEEMQRVLADLNEVLVSEVQEALNFYFEQSNEQDAISQVCLLGGGARIMGLDALLASTLQAPVQAVNPFNNISVNPQKFEVDYILMQGHLFGVALGLAMRRINDDK